MNGKTKEFLKGLQVLMQKYNASIGFGCGEFSDFDGIHNPHMMVEVDGASIRVTDEYTFSANDIDEVEGYDDEYGTDNIDNSRRSGIDIGD